MSEVRSIEVKDLYIDLNNYRTVEQQNETSAVHAMITINSSRIWALLESIVDDGYYPIENILVQRTRKGHLIVKEGNRRISVLKIALGLLDVEDSDISIPDYLKAKISKIDKQWIMNNKAIPCVIYSPEESNVVDKIVARTHAKGEKAGRDPWNAVGTARHDRKEKGKSTPGLDLLEKYLEFGKNKTAQQTERWAGEYHLTVLDETIQKLLPILAFASTKDLVAAYPQKNKKLLDAILLDIAQKVLTFPIIRNKTNFWGTKYGITNPNQRPDSDTSEPSGPEGASPNGPSSTPQPPPSSTTPPATNPSSPNDPGRTKNKTKPKATPSNVPTSVKRKLKSFNPKGNGREKLVALLNEMRTLKIDQHPHAFCFLLRCVFELSAKAYCNDHNGSGGPSTKKNGNDKNLAKLLGDIVDHLTQNNSNKEKVKELHGATAELGKRDGMLSVTSMNQLVHNRSFSILPGDICTLFHNVFPLLEAMNN